MSFFDIKYLYVSYEVAPGIQFVVSSPSVHKTSVSGALPPETSVLRKNLYAGRFRFQHNRYPLLGF